MKSFKNNKRAFEPGNVIYSNQTGNLAQQQYAEQVQRSKEAALVVEYDKQAAIVKKAEERLAKAPTFDSKLDPSLQAEVSQKQQEKQELPQQQLHRQPQQSDQSLLTSLYESNMPM